MVFKPFRKGFTVFYSINIFLFNEFVFDSIQNYVCLLHLLFGNLFTFPDKSTQKVQSA